MQPSFNKLNLGLTLILACIVILVLEADIVNAQKYMQIKVENEVHGGDPPVAPPIKLMPGWNKVRVTVFELGDYSKKIENAHVTIHDPDGMWDVASWTNASGYCVLDAGPLDDDDRYADIYVTGPGVNVYHNYYRQIRVVAGNYEAVIKDHPDDDYLMPSWDINGSGGLPDPDEYKFFLSPYIEADPNPMIRFSSNNKLISHHEVIVPEGTADFVDWQIYFYWAHPGIGLTRDKWSPITTDEYDPHDPANFPETFPNGPRTITWNPQFSSPWPDDGMGFNHFCFFVELQAPLDKRAFISDPPMDNNLAQCNFNRCFWDNWDNLEGCPGSGGPSPPSSPSASYRTETCYEVKHNFFVNNPDATSTADVMLHVELEDWPPDMVFSLQPYYHPDPDFIEIDHFTYVFQNMGPNQSKVATLRLLSPNCDDIGTIDILGTIDDKPIGGIAVQTITSECPTIQIEKKHDVLQGHYVEVSITARGGIYEMGGFDFLIGYDTGPLAAIEVEPGQLLVDCGWESFIYRYNYNGNCGSACPSGLIRIMAIAETNNGPAHAECFGPEDCDEYELAKLKFFVSNDRTFECQYVPIYFYWNDCGDNTYSSVDGEILYIERRVHDYEGNLIWHEGDDINFPEDNRIPHVGAPDYCLNTDPTKPPIRRCPVFKNGGIDIICSDSIDVNCDMNLNGIPYEIADAVFFTNCFISPTLCSEASIAASDCNGDGIPMSVADLVHLIRVITGDAMPYPKVVVEERTASVSAMVNHSAAAVSTNSSANIGAGYFVFEYSDLEVGEPQLINGASNMTLKYSDDDGILKVLVYSMEKDVMIPAGTENIFAVPIAGEGNIELREVELSDYYGNLLEVTIDKKAALPKAFALHQNYPNPFNLSTTIIYELPEATDVTIEVFNVLGQKVTTLFDGRESAGVHSIAWEGKDESGAIVSSGVYFYRISTPGFTAEKKMVLMK